MNFHPAPLIPNRWFGKALLSVVALIWLPPDPLHVIAGLVGALVVGHVLDLWVARLVKLAFNGSNSEETFNAATEPYLSYLFAGLGRIHRASGGTGSRLHPYVDELLHQLAPNRAQRQQALGWFNAGVSDASDLDGQLVKHPIRGTLVNTVSSCLIARARLSPTPAVIAQTRTLIDRIGGDWSQLGAPETSEPG